MGLVEREHLSVFSFGEEAELFLKLRALENEWETRKAGTSELLSMLFGTVRGVERVALALLTEISNDRMMSGLVSISRKKFMDSLLSLGCSWWMGGKDSEGRIMD
ncbi:MAG: hypothetical protein ACR2GU_05885 [Rubrobacteraceae bacterium]